MKVFSSSEFSRLPASLIIVISRILVNWEYTCVQPMFCHKAITPVLTTWPVQVLSSTLLGRRA